MMALVRGVMAASIWLRSIVKDTGSISTNTGRRAGVADGRRGRDESEWDSDDFVARTDPRGQQRQMQRAGPGVHGDERCRAV